MHSKSLRPSETNTFYPESLLLRQESFQLRGIVHSLAKNHRNMITQLNRVENKLKQKQKGLIQSKTMIHW